MIWGKVISNMQKGSDKLMAAAAMFSERVRAELNIMRLRIRTDNVQESVNEQYRIVGHTLVELNISGSLPKLAEQLLQDEKIAAALLEIAVLEKELDRLNDEIKNEASGLRPAPKQKEEPAP
jgi:vacuolar-type H+-ATPase subunit D/Vma8